jgi:hypothetical protein
MKGQDAATCLLTTLTLRVQQDAIQQTKSSIRLELKSALASRLRLVLFGQAQGVILDILSWIRIVEIQTGEREGNTR